MTVVDPNEYWSPNTTDDYGCPIAAIADWATEPGEGATAEEAVAQLIDHHNAWGDATVMTRSEHAEMGYPDASPQTWIIGTEDTTHMTAWVSDTGSGFLASPEAICAQNPWSVPPGA